MSILDWNWQMISDYIRYLGNSLTSLGLIRALYPLESEPESMEWVSQYADANMAALDFEACSTASMPRVIAIDRHL